MKIVNYLIVLTFLSGSLFMTSCGGGSDQGTSQKDQETTTEEQAEEQQESKDRDQGTVKNDEEEMDSGEDQKVVDKSGMDDPAEITVKTPGTTMQNMHYDVDVIKLNQGQKVTVTLDNVAPEDAAAMKHNFVVTKEADAKDVARKGMQSGKDNNYLPDNKEKVLAYTEVVDQGKQTKVEFTLDEKGTYKFICTYPGHYPTMQGTIEVK